MPTVLLSGTLDTKGAEYAFVRDRLRAAGVDVLTIDTGILGEPAFVPDVPREEVAKAAGVELADLVASGDRGGSVIAMSRGLARIIERMREEGRADGALALGGTGGTSLAASAFRVLPLGAPKVIVSTAASGNTAPYIGESDLVLIPSVVDVAGLNRISTRILAMAADAMAGMVGGAPMPDMGHRPMIAASMFGVTTSCVTTARGVLEELGYEVLVFHMTGTGGRVLESLAAQGLLVGTLDMTTTELADELVGGVFSAGEGRLRSAGAAGIPQVVSLGALDMVNFGPKDTVPPEFAHRNLYVHNATTTLMRTTPEECAELGRRLAERVAAGRGTRIVMIPTRGVSAIAVEGQPFHDAEADAALFGAVRAGLADSDVQLLEFDTDINDPEFARRAAMLLHESIVAAGSDKPLGSA